MCGMRQMSHARMTQCWCNEALEGERKRTVGNEDAHLRPFPSIICVEFGAILGGVSDLYLMDKAGQERGPRKGTRDMV